VREIEVFKITDETTLTNNLLAAFPILLGSGETSKTSMTSFQISDHRDTLTDRKVAQACQINKLVSSNRANSRMIPLEFTHENHGLLGILGVSCWKFHSFTGFRAERRWIVQLDLTCHANPRGEFSVHSQKNAFPCWDGSSPSRITDSTSKESDNFSVFCTSA
jgi:hypothetical protein